MSVGSIVKLQSSDLDQLENLLCSNQLPVQDCAEQTQNFYGVFDEDNLVAAGGLESAANYALLRSVVVHHQYRGQGLAKNISRFLIKLADSEGREAVYLLTETAEAYFEKLGFSRIARAEAPIAIKQTLQFASLCPDTANCLMMTLPQSQ